MGTVRRVGSCREFIEVLNCYGCHFQIPQPGLLPVQLVKYRNRLDLLYGHYCRPDSACMGRADDGNRDVHRALDTINRQSKMGSDTHATGSGVKFRRI